VPRFIFQLPSATLVFVLAWMRMSQGMPFLSTSTLPAWLAVWGATVGAGGIGAAGAAGGNGALGTWFKIGAGGATGAIGNGATAAIEGATTPGGKGAWGAPNARAGSISANISASLGNAASGIVDSCSCARTACSCAAIGYDAIKAMTAPRSSGVALDKSRVIMLIIIFSWLK
jgi:hypothetical protein